ncbi:MAG TPA: Uma2 family endonuclease [Isosphaeraceae bacterium]|jgi:Uma2 family endonuclease|nr:Uma2 family endonuclease [Isosphaeraceae bacterium]
MATTHDPAAALATARRVRFTKDQYYKLGDLGFFPDKRIELVRGELWHMTINPPHAIASGLAEEPLRNAFGPGHSCRTAVPLDLGRHNQPEPDIAVVPGNPRDYTSHPTTALLVVEIADATLRRDRTIKAHLNAWADIADSWIVNLVDRQVEVHRAPGPDADRRGRFKYHDVAVVPATGHVEPLAKPGARIAVADLLP